MDGLYWFKLMRFYIELANGLNSSPSNSLILIANCRNNQRIVLFFLNANSISNPIDHLPLQRALDALIACVLLNWFLCAITWHSKHLGTDIQTAQFYHISKVAYNKLEKVVLFNTSWFSRMAWSNDDAIVLKQKCHVFWRL